MATHAKKFQCKYCEKVFSVKSLLKKHLLVHEDPEKLKCKICGKFSSNEKQLKLHLKNLHMRFKCEKCDFEILGETKFNSHRIKCEGKKKKRERRSTRNLEGKK